MHLLDHFRPPLSVERPWESFHTFWAPEIAAALNDGGLPEGFYAIVHAHIGSQVEVDVATMHRDETTPYHPPASDNGGVAVETWAPPTAKVMGVTYPDAIEALVFREGFPTLVGAIELVSPRNKDRPNARELFVAKCLSYLATGVGVLVVDVVTTRTKNLHNQLVSLLEQPEEHRMPDETELYTVGYRPYREDLETGRMEYWPVPLSVGCQLPIMPLALFQGPIIPIDLNTSYSEACRRSAIRPG